MIFVSLLVLWMSVYPVETKTVDVQMPIISSNPIVENVEIHTLEKSRVDISEKEVHLVARLTAAEAMGESEYGQRLVIDTVLNRVDSNEFPNDIESVIFQNNQFSPVTDGRLEQFNSVEIFEQLVLEEMTKRTNTEVLYFTANKYGEYGDPLFSEGHHYFSGLRKGE